MQSGMAPEANLVALKVLDKDGKALLATSLRHLGWVRQNAKLYNIKVVNLSAGAGVTESYWTDPLALAATQLVDQGIVSSRPRATSGRTLRGQEQYGGFLPGHAPWVLTVALRSIEAP